MKELVIIVGTIVLGCMIFNMIAGDNGSIKSASKEVMEKNIKAYEQAF